MTYQLSFDGGSTWEDAPSLGAASLRRTLRHAGPDELSVEIAGPSALTDAHARWARGAPVRLRRVPASGPAENLFSGLCASLSRSASGGSERASATALGPWDILERTVYRQPWAEPSGASTAEVWVPRCVLFRDAQGRRASTTAQILDALSYALSKSPGAFTVPDAADVPAGFEPPFDEQQNISCADAVRRALAMHPHLCVFFDHSQHPPAAVIADDGDLPALTLPLASLSSLEAARRDDLAPSCVALAYIKENTQGGRTYQSTTFDIAGPAGADAAALAALAAAPGALWGVYDLEGGSSEWAEQEYTVEAVGWDSNKSSASWWRRFCPELEAYADVQILQSPAPAWDADDARCVNFLLAGSVPSWSGKHACEGTFTCTALCTSGCEKRELALCFRATVTDLGGNAVAGARTGKERRRVSYDSGEEVPAGLAAALYAEWSRPVWEGSAALAAQETPAGASAGLRLSVSGGAAGWASMGAAVTVRRDDFGAGTLELSFGPGAWIDLDSRVAWLRAVHGRRYAWHRNLKESGAEAASAYGTEAAAAPDPSSHATAKWHRILFAPGAAQGGHAHTVSIDPQADLWGAAAAQEVKLRKVKVLVTPYPGYAGPPVVADCWALCSEPSPTGEAVGFDIRYDAASHQLQKSADGGSTWTMITGGQAVQETVQ